jgi:hypothetical protein
MKRATIIVVTILLLSVVVYAFASIQSQPTTFKIRVHLTDGKFHAECIQGCNWLEVEYSCGPVKECQFLLDEKGVSGTPSK